MNDRLEIAAMAMQGMITNGVIYNINPEGMAQTALRYADALIAAAGEEKPTDYVDRNYMKVNCPHCNGNGVMEAKSSTSGWKLCPRCNGTKIVYTESIVENYEKNQDF